MRSTAQERLRKAIAAIGSTPAAVAKSLGMSRQNMHAILDGRPVRDHFAARMEKLFGIDQNWLLTGKGEMRVRQPDDQDAELPIFDRFPEEPIGADTLQIKTMKVPRSYLSASSPEFLRYVLRVADNALEPFVLKEDYLLMNGHFNLDTQEHRNFFDDRLCAIVVDGDRMLRWVRAEMVRGELQVQLFTRPGLKERTLKGSHAKKVKVVGICVGLVWRPLEALFVLEELVESIDEGRVK